MTLKDDAFEVDALFLKAGDDGEGVMIFAGVTEAADVEPDAPVGSLYLKTSGKIDQKLATGQTQQAWENQGNTEGGGSSGGNGSVIGSLMFYNADGTRDDLDLVSGNIPFFNSDGSFDPIEVS